MTTMCFLAIPMAMQIVVRLVVKVTLQIHTMMEQRILTLTSTTTVEILIPIPTPNLNLHFFYFLYIDTTFTDCQETSGSTINSGSYPHLLTYLVIIT